jgi:hypothetical protein
MIIPDMSSAIGEPAMPLPTGTDLASRQARWLALQQPGAAPGFVFLIRCAEPLPGAPLPPQPDPHPDRTPERLAWILAKHDLLIRHAATFADDTVPFLHLHTGTEIWAEAFGCAVHRPPGQMPFAQALVADAAAAARLRAPELGSSPLVRLLDLADELRRRTGPEAIFGLPDVQSPMDNVSLIWDKSDLFLAMLEAPDAVRRLAHEVQSLMTTFFDLWFARHGTDYIAHYPDYFTRGGLTLSEDEIGTIGPDLFDTFFREHLVALSTRYGGLGVHCCADARHQWDNLASLPGLKVLNFVNPHHRPPDYTRDAHARFAQGPLQMHCGWRPTGPFATWPAQYPPAARVVIEVPVATIDEGRRASDALNAVRFG